MTTIALHGLTAHRFSVDEYHQMIQNGILTEDHRVELLDGWILDKMPHNPSHDSCIDLLVGEIQPLLPDGWFLRVQSAITLSNSEPEPDISVVKGPRGRYANCHPVPDDIAMIIEASESTLHSDRGTKGPLYAKEEIPIYWIVDLTEMRIEIYTNPLGPDPNPTYQKLDVVGNADNAELIIDGKSCGAFAVANIFPVKNSP